MTEHVQHLITITPLKIIFCERVINSYIIAIVLRDNWNIFLTNRTYNDSVWSGQRLINKYASLGLFV